VDNGAYVHAQQYSFHDEVRTTEDAL
jgi:hypothetical protein